MVTAKRITIIVVAIVVIVLAAFVIQVASQRTWERRVWSCYGALGSGAPLKDPFALPSSCAAADLISIRDLGKPSATLMIGFRPPVTMWISYATHTVEYDSYVIDVTSRDGALRARMSHGSD